MGVGDNDGLGDDDGLGEGEGDGSDHKLLLVPSTPVSVILPVSDNRSIKLSRKLNRTTIPTRIPPSQAPLIGKLNICFNVRFHLG